MCKFGAKSRGRDEEMGRIILPVIFKLVL